jgi:glucose/arabinose dehydrogenase/cytochrome c2
MKTLTAVLFIAGTWLSAAAVADDVQRGRQLFKERCAVCHRAEPGDGGGAQGPSLIGVFNRAAAASAFSYSQALRDSKLRWDEPSLNRFLANPAGVVPGTSMVLAVPVAVERAQLIRYFESVRQLKAAPDLESPGKVPLSSARSANWRDDAPGVVHRIDVRALPPPFATPSSTNRTALIAQPANLSLRLPPGFHIAPFANGLAGPRRMLASPNGDVLVAETFGGHITVLHPSPDNSRALRADTFAGGLHQPFGLAFFPDAKHPQFVYVGEIDRVVRFPYSPGDVRAHQDAEVVVPSLPAGGHFTRDVVFSSDLKHLFVSVGSASNVAESMGQKTPAEIKAWEAEHGLGATWGNETDRADVLWFDAAKPGAARIYATGIRNCVGLTVQPSNGALWCTTNERDRLGDDLVPDYSTRVKQGAFYGWPWYYLGAHEDPRLRGQRPDLAGQVEVPDVPYQSHSAPLTMTFYTQTHGQAAFPSDYVGDAIVAFHGSWNRSLRTGYKLVRVRMKDGEPSGDYEDFLTGFVVDDDSVWGRPVATVELNDGSLLMSEDGGNVIYRIWYAP